ncbi:MAG: hypothetical protein KF868_11410 [Acidobacteria bacterium]|nr:hypothetical protein [Acidobacteriota bacterium]
MKKISALLPLLLVLASVAAAQEGGRRGSMTPPANPDKPPTRTVVLTATTGSLSVVSPPGARVVITRISDKRRIEETVPEGAMQAIFNNLAPGQYRVESSLEGHTPRSGQVTIIRNQVSPLDLSLKPITHRIAIQTNAGNGELRYGLPGGALDRIARFDDSGRAVIDEIEEGKYEIEIRAEDLSYRPRKEQIAVSKTRTEFKFDLERKLSETPFFASWNNLKEWDAPKGWTTQGRFLVINEPGLVLPPLEDYRYYQDTDLIAVVNIKQGEAQFILRARDKQNFYRIRIIAHTNNTGELRATLVRQGRERDLTPAAVPIQTLPDGLLNRDLEIVLQAKANRICVKIIDSQTANEFLGAMLDPSQALAIGAPGLAGAAGAQTEVKQFIARKLSGPTQCEPQ